MCIKPLHLITESLTETKHEDGTDSDTEDLKTPGGAVTLRMC